MDSMKPWEQTWKDDGVGRIQATDAITLEVKVAFWRVPGGDAEAARQADEVRKLALAAPAMARALHALLVRSPNPTETNTSLHTLACWAHSPDDCLPECSAIHEALDAAGVPR